MRTVMFSTDETWTDPKNMIFDKLSYTDDKKAKVDLNCGYDPAKLDNTLVKISEAQEIIAKTIPGKTEIAQKLMKNIILLNRVNYITDEDKRKTTDGIFSNQITMEEYYMAKYNIKNSPWLKLLLSIQHVGSDVSPLNEKTSTSSKYTNVFLGTADGAIGKFDKWSVDQYAEDNVIPKLLKDLQGSIDSKAGSYNLSKCMTLLLALSTRYDKLEGVEKTFQFADILTQITNPPCIDFKQSGGGIEINLNELNQELDKELKIIYKLKKDNTIKTKQFKLIREL
jgi:hypothetical protein